MQYNKQPLQKDTICKHGWKYSASKIPSDPTTCPGCTCENQYTVNKQIDGCNLINIEWFMMTYCSIECKKCV